MDARDWDRRYAAADLVWSAEPNRFVAEEVGSLAPGRALDVACGEGRNAIWLAEQGWTVTGVDFSPVALDKARRLAAARDVAVRWVEADVARWAPPPQAFGLVLMVYLHLPAADRREALAHAVAGLAPGGTLLVVGHHVDNLERGYGGPPDPAILLDPDTIATELVQLGLGVARAEQVERPVETDEGPRVALDALVRATKPST